MSQQAIRAAVEQLELRVLLSTGSVSGTLFDDLDGNGVQGYGESGVAGATVYADLNNNGKLDSGEPSATTANDGTYTLSGIPTGAQIIRQVLTTGERESYPAYGGGNHVTVGSSTVTGVNFGETTTAYVSGTVFLDSNGDGQQEDGETGLGGVTVIAYPGTSAAVGEAVTYGQGTTAVTDSTGAFSFTGLSPGTYTFAEAVQPGYAVEGSGALTLTLSSGQSLSGEAFADTVAVLPTSSTLTGTVIGTAGSYENDGNTIAKAFDGNLNTFFDGPTASGDYAGLALAQPEVITQISYAPRVGYAGRMVGGIFQGSDSEDFSTNLTTLYTIAAAPASGSFTTVNVSSATPFQYVRYLAPANRYGDVAEIRFTGYAPTAGAEFIGNTLAVFGTSGNDTINVQFGDDAYTVTVNGTTQTFASATVLALDIDAFNGTNNVTVDGNIEELQSPNPGLDVSIVGGDGNDSIRTLIYDDNSSFGDGSYNGYGVNVYVYGGAGNDSIDIEGGDTAMLVDGDGNDSVYTQAEDDNLNFDITAGNGNDGIEIGPVGGESSQYGTVNVGTGADSFYNSDPDDHTTIDVGDQSFALGSLQNAVVGKVISSATGAGIAGAQVYIDFNNDGTFDSGDTAVTTDSNGVYIFTSTISADQEPYESTLFTVRLATPNGYNFAPSTATSYSLSLIAGNGVSGEDFMLVAAASPVQLTGTTIGTAGSYNNDGNTIAKATDGSLSTFFDGPTANGNYVGIDLGTAGGVVTEVKFASRSGWASRMNGGEFQASNSATFASGVVTLYTIPAGTNPSSTSLTTVTFANTTAYRYYRYLSPASSYGDVAEFQIFGAAGGLTGPAPLTGTTIGTAGSYQNDGNTSAKATDGNLSTFFDGPTSNGNWVGLDLGSVQTIGQIEYAPRSGWASRMVGGEFQTSTTADFSSGVTTIYTITATPTVGVLTTVTLSSPVTARYIRYLSPSGSYGNIAEFQVFG